MYGLKYIIRTVKYYVYILITSFVIGLINIFAIPPIDRLYDNYNTLSNCTAEIISYDNSMDDSDSFVFFDEFVTAKVSENMDSPSLACRIYQFIENMNYTDKSIINQNNIYKGNYSILNKNEASICKSVASENNLDIGSTIYILDNIECEIKYITNDFVNIRNKNFNSKESSIFIGKDTINNELSHTYANFNAKYGEMRNEPVNVNSARVETKIKFYLFNLLLVFVSTILYVVINMFRFKQEAITFSKLQNNGLSNIGNKVFVNELYYAIPIFIIGLIVIVLLNVSALPIVSFCLSILLSIILNFVFVNHSRRHM